MVERARLESVYTSKGYRGFESLPLRNYPKTQGLFEDPAGTGKMLPAFNGDHFPLKPATSQFNAGHFIEFAGTERTRRILN